MLNRYLAANAAFSCASGCLLLFAGDWIARHIPAPGWLWPVIGAGLLLFAMPLVAMTQSAGLARKLTPQVVIADVAWIVLTLAAMLLIRDGLTGVGVALIIVANGVVGTLAWLQRTAWKREHAPGVTA